MPILDIELFESADAVITITGAGLANLIFAQPHLFLILITPPNWFGESALEIIKPFGLRVRNIVPSGYPADSDPFTQHIHLSDEEIESIAQALPSVADSKSAQTKGERTPVPNLESARQAHGIRHSFSSK